MIYLESEDGEPYIDLNKQLVGYPLMDAVWIENGDIEESIASKLNFLEKTDFEKKQGYNTYTMYNIKY